MERQPSSTDCYENEAEAENFLLHSLVRTAGSLATHCERVDGNEKTSVKEVEEVVRNLLLTAFSLAQNAGVDLDKIYEEKIKQVEESRPDSRLLGASPAILNAPKFFESPMTWRDMQINQVQHNRLFQEHIFGRAKYDQLCLYALQLMSLLGSMERYRHGGLAGLNRYAGDLAVLGLNLSILQNMELPDRPASEDPFQP
ncbi:hypothetical protein F4X86_04595 [Candidatus Saccharibacteria bacterium]|nr:hypothetical protein [Candidatus Saccharibacteria bacterium]